MITAGSLEGGDVMIVEPGAVLIGTGESRTQEVAATQLAAWYREDGWEARVQPFPERYVHIDVLVAVLARAARGGLLRGAAGRMPSSGCAPRDST